MPTLWRCGCSSVDSCSQPSHGRGRHRGHSRKRKPTSGLRRKTRRHWGERQSTALACSCCSSCCRGSCSCCHCCRRSSFGLRCNGRSKRWRAHRRACPSERRACQGRWKGSWREPQSGCKPGHGRRRGPHGLPCRSSSNSFGGCLSCLRGCLRRCRCLLGRCRLLASHAKRFRSTTPFRSRWLRRHCRRRPLAKKRQERCLRRCRRKAKELCQSH